MKKYFIKIAITTSCILLCSFLTISAVASVTSSKSYNPNINEFSIEKTDDSINEYINLVSAKNESLTPENTAKIMTTITFSKAMTASDLKKYVELYDIEVVQLQARGYDKQGNRITFFSKTDKGFDETFNILEELAESDNVELAGAIGMFAFAKSETVVAIQNDHRTLLIDTTAEYSLNSEKEIQEGRNSNFTAQSKDSAFVHSIAWDAENAGLVRY